MKHLLMLCALLLLVADFAAASPHKVKIIPGDKDSDSFSVEVVSGFKARLNATERYQTEEGVADLIVNVLCRNLGSYHVRGAICSFMFLYVAPSVPYLWVPIGVPGQAETSEPGNLAEMIFQSFVQATTEGELQKAQSELQKGIGDFCKEAENAKFCKPK